MTPSLQRSSSNGRVGHLHQAGKGVAATQVDWSASVADRPKSATASPDTNGTDTPKSPNKSARWKSSDSSSALRMASSALLASSGETLSPSSPTIPRSPSALSSSSGGGFGPSLGNGGLKSAGAGAVKSVAPSAPMASLSQRLRAATSDESGLAGSEEPETPPPSDLWRRRMSAPGNVQAEKLHAEKSVPETKETATSAPSTSPPNSPVSRRHSMFTSDRRNSLRLRRESANLKNIATNREAPKEIRMLMVGEKIFDVYYWETVLQEDGDGGKVVICQDRKSDAEDKSEFKYIMKIKSKKALEGDIEQYRRTQLRMLNFPRHAGVMPLHEVLEDDNFFYVVAPRASGGSYFAGLIQEWRDGEVPAPALRKNLKQIMQAVGHMHRCGVLHRDIKPDNLVTEVCTDPQSPTGKSNRPVLIDFDHADTDFSPLMPSPKSQDVYGTLRFNAPETFLGEYSAQSDLYSVGVILYMLMAGKMPFNDDIFSNEADWAKSPQSIKKFQWETFEKLRERPIDWSCDPWPSQPSCKDFCQHLLAFDPEERFRTAEDALAHPWFVSED